MVLVPDDIAKKSVLVVEDAWIISEGIAQQLRELGFHDIRTALSLPEAWEAIEGGAPDIALLDIKLGQGKTSLDIARTLLDRKVTVLLTTGYAGLHELPPEFNRVAVLMKPFNSDELAKAILGSLD